MNNNRPDIADSVRAAARQCQDHKAKHWPNALRISAYLNGMRELGITYERGRGMELRACADFDYAKAEGRRSVSGGVVMVTEGGSSMLV